MFLIQFFSGSQFLAIVLSVASTCSTLAAQSQTQFHPETSSSISKIRTGLVDRFFDLSVGSDYPGTLIRDDSQAQLKFAS